MCPKIKRFWMAMVHYANTHLVNYLPLTPECALLGLIDIPEVKASRGCKQLFTQTVQANCISFVKRKTILHKWIYLEPPTIPLFVDRLSYICHMEWVDFHIFFDVWESFFLTLPTDTQHSLVQCFQYTQWY